MASIDLSTHAREIESAYDSIVAGDSNKDWALFAYGAGFNNQSLTLQATGSGGLEELKEEFLDGKIQYAFARVTDPNTQLPKFVLIGWCGAGVPERAKGYFNMHFGAVARVMHGYHVQITARSEDDVEPEEILRKVEDASGSKYSVSDLAARFSKAPPVRPKYAPLNPTSHADESDWGDAPAKMATEITKVASAYKPTKVDLDAIRKSSQQERTFVEPVKSAYQPIGKVDIAAIRAQASKKELEAERPDIIKGAYQPIGKVDIAAIRAAAKQNEDAKKVEDTPKPPPMTAKPTLSSNASPAFAKKSVEPPAEEPEESSRPISTAERTKAFVALESASERLFEMPKPKVDKSVTSRFGSASRSFGTSAVLPKNEYDSAGKAAGGFSKNFGNEGGKTPAQLWAERRAKTAGGSVPASTPAPEPVSSAQAPKPVFSSSYREPEAEETEEEAQPHEGGVAAMRERLARASISTEEAEAQEDKGRHPSFAARSSSPIRLAKPISTSSTSTIFRPVTATAAVPPPPRSPSPEPEVEEPVVEEPEDELEPEHESETPIEEFKPDSVSEVEEVLGSVRAAKPVATPAENHSITAVVQYDYQKEEDNEIDLAEGEIITNIEEVDDGWWSGVNSAGEHGLFPANYVELIESNGAAPAHEVTPSSAPAHAEPSPVLSPEQHVVEPKLHAPELGLDGGPSAVAMYEYEAQEDNELSFPEGAMIEDIQFPDEDWWSGVYNGERKLFPANYVTLS
ncbi:uncharacterized protein V1518DRAFT_418715 [Limtongia smithiae]|uniref:uncharacterized protein n=1 Tax=Limtongia smithiae TaxID=1125753 RepID=UPI0034CEEAD1